MAQFTEVDYDPFESGTTGLATAAPAFSTAANAMDLGHAARDPAQNGWGDAPLQVTVRPQMPAPEPIAGVSAPPPTNWMGGLMPQQQPATPGELPQAPPAAPATVVTPLAASQKMQAELQDPYVMDRLIAMTRAEVSNLGPEGAHKFLETIRNRAAADGKTLAQVLGDPRYFPRATFARASMPVSDAERASYGPLVAQTMSGSNTANYATGNASWDPVKQKWVGFQGGPTTATAGHGLGKELYGIERPNLEWAKSVGYEGGPEAPYPGEGARLAAAGGGDPFERAAFRQRQGVQPEEGRKRGLATFLIENLLAHKVREGLEGTRRTMNSAANLQRYGDQGVLGDYDPGAAIRSVGTVASSSIPMAKPGSAGVFGGRLSQTADHAKLIQAENMAAAGVPAAKIHQDTGWFQGADGKWRYEISDKDMTVNPGFGTLEQSVEHPDLFAAYPHMREGVHAEVKIADKPGSAFLDMPKDRPPYMHVEDTAAGVRGTVAHELQHAVQDHEGFASGAAPDQLPKKLRSAAQAAAESLADDSATKGKGKPWAQRTPEEQKQLADFMAFQMYHMHAGEVEARSASKRVDMTPEERAASFPPGAEDVTRENQLVRMPGRGISRGEKFERAKPPEPEPPPGFIPVEHDPFAFQEYPGAISTRLPTAVRSGEDPFKSKLIIDTNAMKMEPDLYKHNVALTRAYPLMTTAESRLPLDQAADAFVNKVKDNLLWLHDQVPPEVASRSKLWYDGANKIVKYRAKEYGVPDSSVAGVYAAMSPQKDWFQNVSLGDRVMDSYFNHANTPLEPRWLPSDHKLVADFRPQLDLIQGKTLNELVDPSERALWIRVHDQTTRSPEHYLITPEGRYDGMVKTGKGENAKMGWGSLTEIGKALQALEAKGDANAISRLMGERHKVRNFYNNLLHPNAPHGDVTIDTHAVAGGLLQPLGGSAPEVAHNFGNYAGKGVPAAKSSARSGVGGTYGLYADAYRKAAEERGILPREMQSITWEAARGLFKDTFKSQAANVAAIRGLWDTYRRGKMPIEEVRNAILERAGGVDNPPWYTPGAGVGKNK